MKTTVSLPALICGVLACGAPEPPAKGPEDSTTADREAVANEALNARLEAERRDAEKAKARQDSCGEQLQRIQVAELLEAREQATAEKLRRELAACPNSGLPAGTYSTRDDAPGRELLEVDVEVTDKGCAAFLASDSRCTVTGIVDASKQSALTERITRGQHCSEYDNAGIIKFRAFKGTKLPIEVLLPALAQKRGLRLRQTSDVVAIEAPGFPGLWMKARMERENDPSNARTSVVFAQPPAVAPTAPAVGAPSPGDAHTEDRCQALDAAKTRWDQKHAK